VLAGRLPGQCDSSALRPSLGSLPTRNLANLSQVTAARARAVRTVTRPRGQLTRSNLNDSPQKSKMAIWNPDPSDNIWILGYVWISTGYPWDILTSLGYPWLGQCLTYPIFVNFKLRYPWII
jgi:hypothetical protein